MNKLIKSITCAIMLLFGVAHAQNTPSVQDTLTDFFLKDSQLDIIKSATSITAYRVHDFKAAPEETNLLGEFKVLESVALDEAQTANVKQLLATPQNYFFTSKLKQCMFLPQRGLQVISEKDTMNVLVSFGCQTIRFHDGESFKLIDLHLGAEPFFGFFSEVFPGQIQVPEPTIDNTVEGLVGMPIKFDDCSEATGEFQTKMAAPKPIHYIISDPCNVQSLVGKVNEECNLKVDAQKICQLNNLTENCLMNLKKGDAIVVGYENN